MAYKSHISGQTISQDSRINIFLVRFFCTLTKYYALFKFDIIQTTVLQHQYVFIYISAFSLSVFSRHICFFSECVFYTYLHFHCVCFLYISVVCFLYISAFPLSVATRSIQWHMCFNQISTFQSIKPWEWRERSSRFIVCESEKYWKNLPSFCTETNNCLCNWIYFYILKSWK